MSNIAAAIITIGDELLIGQTIDTNSAWIARKLNELGIDVLRRVAVGDRRDDIITALNEELPRASLIFITGGLGPTSDDITKPLLCDYFGGKLVVDEKVKAHLLGIFAKRNRPILERNMKQAEVPDTCTVLFNRMGTAPGMLFEKDGKRIISMPGVPFEMQSIMEDEVLPLLRKELSSDALLHRTVYTAGEGESIIAERIADLEAALPDFIRLAYLPDAGMVRLRLTGRHAGRAMLEAELNRQQALFADRLSNIVIALEDIPIEQILGNAIKAKGQTIGIAESCTGGQIGSAITNIEGSSAYFLGSVVSYDNRVKENLLGVNPDTIARYGAVSEETAREMVIGARNMLLTDYALAVTGVLGPGGATDRVKVGTVWMAVASNDKVLTREFHFFYDRIRNKEMAVKSGMLFLWRLITGKI